MADDLEVLRHSTAHVMAQAVCDLWPGAKYAIGPPIEDGFYYDFELPEQLTPDDLPRIEARMREIVQAEQPFKHEEVPREEAFERFADQPYKREIIEGVEEAEGAKGDTVSIYRNDGWQDLCLGPHVEDTGKLGPALDLFSFPNELGAGLAVWHPKGGRLLRQLGDFIREIHVARGYELVTTPHVARSGLWETSGHLEKYAGNMYPPMHDEAGDYYVKPMNCPFHVLIYKSRTRSYRDLPLRMSELATVYRHEKAGTLHGLLRIRGLSMDDAHIFCTPDQLIDEVLGVFDMTLEVFRVFGFEEPRIELSTKPGEAIGDEAMWARATDALRGALDKSGMAYDVAEGEGAFYGPKVDFHFRDAIGRSWQLTTVQCDFALPERFDLEFMAEDNQRHRPVMIHRAILGSLERFIAILIEHHAGAFPLWLAPEQVRVIPIADRHHEHARGLADRLRVEGLRADVDDSNETLGKKVRAAQLEKVPYVLVVGDKEEQGATVAVRDRAGVEARGVPLEAFLARAIVEDKERALETGDVGAL